MNTKLKEGRKRLRSAQRNEHEKQLFSESAQGEPLCSRPSPAEVVDCQGSDHRADQLPLNSSHFDFHLLNRSQRRTKTSLVWNFFHIDPLYICRATCNICLKSVSRGQRINQLGTSTLQRHLQSKHPLEWALACQAEISAGCETPDQHLNFSASELLTSLAKIRELVPNDQAYLEECHAPGKSSFCAPESPHFSNSHANCQEPKPTYHTHLKEDPVTQNGQSPFKWKNRELIQMQPNEELYQNVTQVEPISIFSTHLFPGDLDGYVLLHNNSFNSLQAPRKRTKRNKSPVWMFFLVDPRYPSKATCVVCNRSVSRGRPGTQLGTSTLQRHLLSKHPVHWSMANKSSFESDLLENPLRFSMPPPTAEEPRVCSVGTSTSFPPEGIEMDSTDRKSVEQYVDKLPEEQEEPWLKENITPEPILLNCAGKKELCGGTLHKEQKHCTNKNPKPEPLLWSNCAADSDTVCVTRLKTQQIHWTSENVKLEPADVLECAGKVQLCKLPRDEGHCTKQNSKPKLVSLTNCSDKVGLYVGRLSSERGNWNRENLTLEPASLSSIVNKKMVCIGRPHRKQTHDDISEKGRVSLSNYGQTENDPLSISHATTTNFLDSSGCDKERFLNKTYPVKRVHILGERSKRKKSPVWLFFSIDPQFSNSSICNVCGKSVSRGRPGTPLGTSTLQRHLLAKHRTHWDRANKGVQEVETPVAKHPTSQPEIPILNITRVTKINRVHSAQMVSSAVPRLRDRGSQGQVKKVQPTSKRKKPNRRVGQKGLYLSKRQLQSKKCLKAVDCSASAMHNTEVQLVYDVGKRWKVTEVFSNSVPLQPKWTKRVSSPVWNFFYIDPECISHAICTVCKRSVSRGKVGTQLGTSTLQRHLLAKHPMHWKLVL